MKVSELKIGMLIRPKGDYVWFPIQGPENSTYKWCYVRKLYLSSPISDVCATYLGTRKEMNLASEDSQWSNRFILVAGEIYSVDPSAWPNILAVD